MKQIDYLAPEMEVLEVELEGMLCLSVDGEAPTGGNEIPGLGPEE